MNTFDTAQIDNFVNFEDSEAEEDSNESLFNDPITKEEIVASVKKLKPGKSCGSDKILGEMLKHGITVVIDYLVLLFNKLLTVEHFH